MINPSWPRPPLAPLPALPGLPLGPRGLPLHGEGGGAQAREECTGPQGPRDPHPILPRRRPGLPLSLGWSCYLGSTGHGGEGSTHPGGHGRVMDSGVRQAGVLLMLLMEKKSQGQSGPHPRPGRGRMKLNSSLR